MNPSHKTNKRNKRRRPKPKSVEIQTEPVEIQTERSSILRRVHTFGRFFGTALKKLGTGVAFTFRYLFRRTKVHPTISLTDLLQQTSSSDSDSSGTPEATPTNSFTLRNFGLGNIFRPLLNFTHTVVPEKEDLTKLIVQLPTEVRYQIYSYLSPLDILALRLVNKAIKIDISQVKGLQLKLNDVVANYDWIKDVSIEGITIDYWCDEITSNSVWMSKNKLPQLKSIHIRGRLIPENLQALVSDATNLEHFKIDMTQFNISLQPELFTGSLKFSQSLKDLQIIMRISSNLDSKLCLKNLKSLLLQINRCRNLHALSIDAIFMMDSTDMDEFHLLFLRFIRFHASVLKKVDVSFKQILYQGSLPPRQSISSVLGYQSWTNKLQLHHLNLALEKIYVGWWVPLLLAQKSLISLDLNLKGELWTVIPGVIRMSHDSIERVSVNSISLPTEHGRRGNHIIPLDFNCFKYCSKLTNLNLTHVESNPLATNPLIRGTQDLPMSLKSVAMKYLVLKPHQQLSLLLKFPCLESLTLGHWTESEESFGSFLIVLAFTVHFGLTNIQSFELVETKRTVEHRTEEVNKMIQVLQNKADVYQEERLTECSLKIMTRTTNDS